MNIKILTSYVYHSLSELTGEDKVIMGGAERYLVELCHFLQSEGHNVKVYQSFGDTYTDAEGNVKRTPQLEKNFYGIPVACLPVPGGGWSYTTNPYLNTVFNETAADADLRIYFASFCCWNKVIHPAISISHGIFWDFNENPYKNMTEPERKEFWRRQLYGFTEPDICVSVDSNVRKVLQAVEPGVESNIRIIPNFVDCEKFYPVQKTWNGIRVLYPRRLTMIRGCNDFIRASRDLPDYDFLAVGQCHDEALGETAKQWGNTTSNLRFIERPMEQMAEIYQGSDIAVIPTKAAEGTSLAGIESMACGLPLITTPVGGLGDLVIDGFNALLYDPNHDDLSEYIERFAEDEGLRKKFGGRNRKIAEECFDIKIWHQKWREVINQFEHHPKVVKRREFEKRHKPKLVAMMLTHNETGRYLERVVKNTLSFADELVILDDHSDDFEYMKGMLFDNSFIDGNRIHIKQAENSWENESALRVELFQFALTRNPDWVIAVDADELFEPRLADKVQEYMRSRYNWIAFRFFDMWNDEGHYRDDEGFKAGPYGPRMFRVKGIDKFQWSDRRRHCGSIPANLLELPGMKSDIRVKHLGWLKESDRLRKYKERVAEDPNGKYLARERYEAILDANPTLVKWDDNNPWQTSKLTIAYPPGMEWNIMQQRPHHLLRLAASEKYRVFFGDKTASYTGEVEPYLTIVRDWQEVKDVDILYVTSPNQMEYCKNLKYKKLIYDCCDWQNGNDVGLIKMADHVFFASNALYERLGMYQTPEEIRRGKFAYLPNACDYDHFSKAGDPTEDIVGYWGVVSSVIDPNLINALAEEWKLLLIGQNKGARNGNSNITLAGHVPYHQLPEAISQIKVGIIPFRTDSDYLKYSAPIKVYEYLAAGRPVVASPIPELMPLADEGLIWVVENDKPRAWIEAVKRAMTEYPNEKGREWAKGQTWKHRWKAMKEVLGWN